jgi:predicted ribosomally synthesized peptide with SipW-like signal peptide
MDRTRKVASSLLVVGVVGALATLGALSAFTSQANNPNNRVTAGTVTLADNDGGTALYDFTGAKPGDSQTSCIRVSYSGSLNADVKLYTPDTIGALGPYVNLKIEPGSQASPSFPSCTGFTADGAAIFDAALSTFPTSYASGVSDFPGASSAWTNSDAVVYRVTATLSASAPDSAQGATTGLHTIRWEAHNQ